MMIDQFIERFSIGQSIQKPNFHGTTNFNNVLASKTALQANGSQATPSVNETSQNAVSQTPAEAKIVKIGTITSKNPTVSNLLIRDTALKKECWNIIHDEQNRGKDYTRIKSGTEIYYNPDTRELLWGDMIDKNPKAAMMAAEGSTGQGGLGATKAGGEPESTSDKLNENLVKAVQPMIGKAYSDVNCYELLVNGLSRMGVKYCGQGGLGRRLMANAVEKGLPMNAYLNGEGLVAFSGSKTYGKSFYSIHDPAGQARQLIEEMTPHLERGSILSFSTESRGHTGIVSNKDGTWTYINSGVMDNPVDPGTSPKGVGEEMLDREIENWFQLAARRKESLVVTLGKLNQNKLAAYGTGKKHTVS